LLSRYLFWNPVMFFGTRFGLLSRLLFWNPVMFFGTLVYFLECMWSALCFRTRYVRFRARLCISLKCVYAFSELVMLFKMCAVYSECIRKFVLLIEILNVLLYDVFTAIRIYSIGTFNRSGGHLALSTPH
jgi:hypothetical protein